MNVLPQTKTKNDILGKFKVSRYECPECKEKFNSYVSDDDKTFTIPKVD